MVKKLPIIREILKGDHNAVAAARNLKQKQTRPTHRRTDANLYPPERQLTKASEPSFDLEGGAKGQIRPHRKIPSP